LSFTYVLVVFHLDETAAKTTIAPPGAQAICGPEIRIFYKAFGLTLDVGDREYKSTLNAALP
jgi:hypothetical protein